MLCAEETGATRTTQSVDAKNASMVPPPPLAAAAPAVSRRSGALPTFSYFGIWAYLRAAAAGKGRGRGRRRV